MSTTGRMRPAAGQPGRHTGEDGQIMILVLGYALIAFLLVVVAVDVTAVYLARTQLRDAADAAALDAADAAYAPSVYSEGVSRTVPLSDATVRTVVVSYLSTYRPPNHVEQVRLDPATGSSDGATAVVALSARVRLPLLGPVLRAWSGGVTVSVQARARADVDGP
jgi:uncharacterized membrane protein